MVAGTLGRLGAGAWCAGLLAALLGAVVSLVSTSRVRRFGRVAVATGMALVLAGCPASRSAPPDQFDGAVYYLSDHLGSSTVLLDGAGAVVSRATYDAWGFQTSATSEPYTFTGQEWDAEAGLYHLGKRYYDPKLGWFLSVDAGCWTGRSGPTRIPWC